MRCVVFSASPRLRSASALVFGISLLLAIDAGAAVENNFAFDVQVSLSPKAAAKLAALSESIVIAATYSGEPVPSAEKHANQIGQIDLGAEHAEIPGKSATVHISGDKLKRERLAWIRGPVLLNVNVYSARRSGPDNILSCDFFDGNLRDAAAKPPALHCALIVEGTMPKPVQ
jgi:hypothetical protein